MVAYGGDARWSIRSWGDREFGLSFATHAMRHATTHATRHATVHATWHGRRRGRAAIVAWKQPSPPHSPSSSSSSSPSHAPSPPSAPPPGQTPSPPPTTAAPPAPPPLRAMYPACAHHAEGYIKVSAIHSLYYRIYGNPAGKPALFLHGGPGAGCWPNHARFFDPAVYRIVLCDQRGAGRSTPAGCVVANRTELLVGDIEALREHLKVDRWAVVMGGSWGTTLALAYAQAHPGRVAGMVLRGVCLLRRREIDWFYRPGGAEALFPFAWRDLMAALPSPAPTHAHGDGDENGSGEVAKEEASPDGKERREDTSSTGGKDLMGGPHISGAVAQARIECHYFHHDGFLADNQLLRNIDAIRHIPTVIVHGRYDFVCPLVNAIDLHHAWPEAQLRVVPNAGHSMYEPGITHELIVASDHFRDA
ncbi:unnamed protein product [Closterium sp. Yama58-4]|nr:unnamed protein product [Closterium sp. Yama58-4]